MLFFMPIKCKTASNGLFGADALKKTYLNKNIKKGTHHEKKH